MGDSVLPTHYTRLWCLRSFLLHFYEKLMANAKKPQPWPYKAASAADEIQAYLLSIRDLARKIQVAVNEGNTGQALILAGDVREKAMTAEHVLANARRGEYEQ